MIAIKPKIPNGGEAPSSPGIFGDISFTPSDGERFANKEREFPFVPTGGLGFKPAGEVPSLREKPYAGPQVDKKKSA